MESIAEFVVFWLLLGASYAVSSFLLPQMVLPIIYGLPLSLWFFLRREIAIGAVLTDLAAPAIWFFVLVGVGTVGNMWAPDVLDFILDSVAIALGQLAAIAMMIGGFIFSPKQRATMWADYYEGTYLRFKRS